MVSLTFRTLDRAREFYRWVLGVCTRYMSQIARSALCGYVVSRSSAFIAIEA